MGDTKKFQNNKLLETVKFRRKTPKTGSFWSDSSYKATVLSKKQSVRSESKFKMDSR